MERWRWLAAGNALAPVARVLGGAEPGRALYDFARRMGAPTALKDFGVTEADMEHAADLALTKPYWNPAPIEKSAIRALLQAAWAGDAPDGLWAVVDGGLSLEIAPYERGPNYAHLLHKG